MLHPCTLRPTATHLRKFTKNETRKAYNLIIGPPLFVDQSHWVLTAAVPFSSFTTGNSCNVCHMCGRHQQSRKLLRKVPRLPQDDVYSWWKRGKRSGHFSALRPRIKGKKSRDGTVPASVVLEEHAGLWATPCFKQPKIWSPVKPHPACLRWTGLEQEGLPSVIHSSVTDGSEGAAGAGQMSKVC